MDLAQIYMASPDWIKALMVLLPFATVYATARLFAPRRVAAPEPASSSAPMPYRPLPASPAFTLLGHETEIGRLDRIKEGR